MDGQKKQMDESGVEPETFRMLSERATNYATRPNWKMVPSRIELLISALLAPRLNQLGQGTYFMDAREVLCSN